jgi:hypothetical protein
VSTRSWSRCSAVSRVPEGATDRYAAGLKRPELAVAVDACLCGPNSELSRTLKAGVGRSPSRAVRHAQVALGCTPFNRSRSLPMLRCRGRQPARFSTECSSPAYRCLRAPVPPMPLRTNCRSSSRQASAAQDAVRSRAWPRAAVRRRRWGFPRRRTRLHPLLRQAWHPGTLYKLQDASKSLTRTGWVDRVAKPGRMANGPAAKMFPNALGSLVDKLSSGT